MALSRFTWANAVLRWRTRATSKSLNKITSPEEKKEKLAAEEVEENDAGKAEEGVPFWRVPASWSSSR
ncbi:hypothetical protein B296_00057638 [Ensete ventricosum]|uniref:Uncharacterized protein n=1 Tax=Ensete ventricosum TaxID=4639 RepID=A0A426XQC6_ENSVE|nr:hypothetical protein B296_00057638 [Ensete ventricosum]